MLLMCRNLLLKASRWRGVAYRLTSIPKNLNDDELSVWQFFHLIRMLNFPQLDMTMSNPTFLGQSGKAGDSTRLHMHMEDCWISNFFLKWHSTPKQDNQRRCLQGNFAFIKLKRLVIFLFFTVFPPFQDIYTEPTYVSNKWFYCNT